MSKENFTPWEVRADGDESYGIYEGRRAVFWVDKEHYLAAQNACTGHNDAMKAALATTEAPRVDEKEALADKFQQALALLWFWLPEQEPDPHSKSKAITERNKRWHAACKLYQEECKK